MIVNNHHLATIPGEDYQTFERDLPGQNTGGGFSAEAVISNDLPLECSDIIGRSWGYVTNDTVNRSVKQLIHLLIGCAGRGANLLLNIGPTPEGEVRPAHRERLLGMGEWLKTYGETLYDTRKSFMEPADWGVAVQKDDIIYLHITDPAKAGEKLVIGNFPGRVKKAYMFETGKPLSCKVDRASKVLTVQLTGINKDAIDNVIVLKIAG
jgi:alpha-L-fucosidase